MSVLFDKQTTARVVRRFERSILESTLQSAQTQLRARIESSADVPGSTGITASVIGKADNAAELLAGLIVYGVHIPSPIRLVSAGCIEAMRFVRDEMGHTRDEVPLNRESLSYLASFFSSPKRLDALLAGATAPEDPDLRRLLEDWGGAFIVCIHSLGTRWPGLGVLAGTADRIAAQASEQAPLPSIDASKWTEQKNARRCHLIDRQIQGIITTGEAAELDALQHALRVHLDSVAPVPLEAARRLHAELLRKGSNE
jgi:hypothetical protein